MIIYIPFLFKLNRGLRMNKKDKYLVCMTSIVTKYTYCLSIFNTINDAYNYITLLNPAKYNFIFKVHKV
jgi:hypothetical protein